MNPRCADAYDEYIDLDGEPADVRHPGGDQGSSDLRRATGADIDADALWSSASRGAHHRRLRQRRPRREREAEGSSARVAVFYHDGTIRWLTCSGGMTPHKGPAARPSEQGGFAVDHQDTGGTTSAGDKQDSGGTASFADERKFFPAPSQPSAERWALLTGKRPEGPAAHSAALPSALGSRVGGPPGDVMSEPVADLKKVVDFAERDAAGHDAGGDEEPDLRKVADFAERDAGGHDAVSDEEAAHGAKSNIDLLVSEYGQCQDKKQWEDFIQRFDRLSPRRAPRAHGFS